MIPKIDSLSEISNLYSNQDVVCNTLKKIFDRLNITRALASGKGYQKNGRSVSLLFILLIMKMMKGNHSVHSLWKNNFYQFINSGKNGFYRFLNRPQTDWRRVLTYVSLKYRSAVNEHGVCSPKTEACFIIDDTVLEKTGVAMEGISRVYDHTKDTCVLGYKMLVLGYNDGTTTQALDFSLHRESSKNNFGLYKRELHKSRAISLDTVHPDLERKKELDITKLDSSLRMLKRALRNKFKAKYLLADSWFSSADFIQNVRRVSKDSVDYLGIGRKDASRYKIRGVGRTPKQIIDLNSSKKKKRNIKYSCEYFTIDCSIHDCPVRLIFIKNTNSKEWNFIITTDMDLSFEKAYELYQIRWTIEVLFKECKQYFNLGKCQAEYFNEQVADCTIVLIVHTLITLENRFSNYETLGGLFSEIADQLTIMTLWERIILLIVKIMKAISKLISEPIFELVRRLIVMNHGEIKAMFNIIKSELIFESKNSDKSALIY